MVFSTFAACEVLAMYLLLCSIANLLAWREGEEYEERKKRKKKKDEPEYQMSYSDQFRAFIHTVIYQGDGKMYLFVPKESIFMTFFHIILTLQITKFFCFVPCWKKCHYIHIESLMDYSER